MLLTSERLPFSNLLNLRCDNQAVLAMLESPTWRSRHISIRDEAIRAKLAGQVILTFVATTNQIADPLTKPIGTLLLTCSGLPTGANLALGSYPSALTDPMALSRTNPQNSLNTLVLNPVITTMDIYHLAKCWWNSLPQSQLRHTARE
eukprot:3620651-Amphidinium_carterae.3